MESILKEEAEGAENNLYEILSKLYLNKKLGRWTCAKRADRFQSGAKRRVEMHDCSIGDSRADALLLRYAQELLE